MRIIITCVLLHLGWKSKTCQLTGRSVILKIFSSCCDTNCCRCADNLQILVVLKKSCCLVCGFLRLIITVYNVYKLKLAVFVIAFHDGLHRVDPCVLVSGLRCSGKDSELSLTTGNIKNCIHKCLSNFFCTSLVYENLTAVFVRCGVEGRYLDSLIHSFLKLSLKSVNIVSGDTDCIEVLRNQVVKNLDLRISCSCLRINDLNLAAFSLYCLLERFRCDLEECITGCFTNQSDLFAFCRIASCCFCLSIFGFVICCKNRANCTKNHCSTKDCANYLFFHCCSSL